MKNHSINRMVPLDDSWDVIVAGGGPAGCTAAIAAAREGARTLLIEATGCLGGMGTGGLIPAWCPFSDKERVIYAGLGERIMETVKATMKHVPKQLVDWVPIDAETLKVVYDDMVTESGATVLFNTFLSAVETDGAGSVTAIICTNKDGLTAYSAKVFVDCTGDGDLSVWAGADYEKGGPEGELQPGSLCFTLSNVDSYGYLYGVRLHGGNPDSPVHKMVMDGKYPYIKDAHMCNNFVGPGTVGFNAGHVFGVDNTLPANVTEALMTGRKIARNMRDALAEYVPEGFANSFLVQTGSLMGIRETRRIVADYRLTTEDFLERKTFEDEICRNCYFIDVHHTREQAEKIARGEMTFKDLEKTMTHYNPGESHGVPYRCLTPKGLKNVLIAGRSISSDRTINGSLRVMPVCLAMGEAAGMAAAMATSAGNDVRKVDVKKLRGKLREAGQYLP